MLVMHALIHFPSRLWAAVRAAIKRKLRDRGRVSPDRREDGRLAVADILRDMQLLAKLFKACRDVKEAFETINQPQQSTERTPGQDAQIALCELHSDPEGYESDRK
ncbi:hypothetical protein FOA52_005271 [Chlamydomonas sp. UWO 241]|nr:hypothetical protein FOA52_005271 [Chlamydomonas sp. UWO 241]